MANALTRQSVMRKEVPGGRPWAGTKGDRGLSQQERDGVAWVPLSPGSRQYLPVQIKRMGSRLRVQSEAVERSSIHRIDALRDSDPASVRV